MKGRSISAPYGGKMKRKGGTSIQRGGKLKHFHHKLEKVLKKPNKKTCGGFIFPLIGHVIKAVRSNNAHKERVKKQAYDKSPEGRKAAIENEYKRGVEEREHDSAFKKGYEGGRTKKHH